MTSKIYFFTGLSFVSFCLLSCSPEKKSTLSGFQIEPGFTLTLVAGEPLIKDPVDLEFDENGNAFVLEMPGYPFEDQQSRIVLLKDENQDGIYEGQSLYAENLQLASSIMPCRKGMLVAAPPYLLHVKDTDGDFKVDVIDTLMGGFSTGNLQHNYNGLTYGNDNWIYAVNGGNSGKPYWWRDSTSVMDMRGQDFRFNLETRVMERIGESSGGFGLGMDEWGHLYETHNLEHISHLVFPDRYQNNVRLLKNHSLSIISDHEENGLARIYPIGEQESRVNHPEQSGYFSGSCGITYYGGGAYGTEYENTVWVADVVLNLIHVDKIKSTGASFTASRVLDKRDFLASTDRSFRPVNMTVGPDGSIHVIDMYRQVIEHPEWIPDEIEKTLDLHAGKDKGRIYKIQKEGTKKFDFKKDQFKSVDSLISSLSNSNQWVRKTAHRLLMEKALNESETESLKQVLSAESDFARLHAMMILFGKKTLTNEHLLQLLSDPAPGIRENALIIAEQQLSAEDAVLQKVLNLTKDDDQRVRMQAILSISTMSKVKSERYNSELFNALAESSKKAMDDWNVAAITLAARHAPAELFAKLVTDANEVENITLLESLAGISGLNRNDITTVLGSLVTSTLKFEKKQSIVDRLALGIPSNISNPSALAAIRQLEKSGDLGMIASLASLRQRLSLPPSQEFLAYSKEASKKLADRTLPDSIRFKQMSLVALLPYQEKSEILFQCLDNSQPLNIQEAALRQLAESNDLTIGTRLVKRWTTLGPIIRRWCSDLLLYKEIYHDALLTGLENGTINIGEMNFDLERRRQLLWWTDNEETKRRAEKLFSDAGVTTRQEAITSMKEALTLTGSTINGAKVFESSCGLCHMYGAVGQHVGPVLTEINRKSKEAIMHEILDPNAAVDTKYINHRLVTNSGDIHIGIVDNETDQFITIKKMGGATATVSKKDIKTFNSLGTSLMMEGLEATMTTQDMADLLAFLQNQN